MTRPRKQTVDYFPHVVNHGRTMFVIEERYGNDGYAFWFKLLETLGDTEGHALDLNDSTNEEYLRSKTHLTRDKMAELLTVLAKLGAIDADLWEQKIVWSQNFVDGVASVYTGSRHSKPPERPHIYAEKPHERGLSTQGNPQSKVKESKVKESIEDPSPFPPIIEPDKPKRKIKTSLPAGFEASDRVKKWAAEKNINGLTLHLESFLSKCRAHNYQYVDWDEAFMTAIRDNWAGVKTIYNPGNERAQGKAGDDVFTVCPRCKREVLKTDRTARGCFKCEEADPRGKEALGRIMAGIGGEA